MRRQRYLIEYLKPGLSDLVESPKRVAISQLSSPKESE